MLISKVFIHGPGGDSGEWIEPSDESVRQVYFAKMCQEDSIIVHFKVLAKACIESIATECLLVIGAGRVDKHVSLDF